MDDPELAVRAHAGHARRSPRPRSRSGSRPRAVRKRRKLREQPPHGFRRAHHDRRCRSERAPMRSRSRRRWNPLGYTIISSSAQGSPRSATHGLPSRRDSSAPASPNRRAASRRRSGRTHRGPARRGRCSRRSTTATSAGAGRATAPPGRASGASLGLAAVGSRSTSSSLGISAIRRLVLGRPAVGGRAAAGHDDLIPAELVEEAGHPQRPLRARAADRREVVRVEEQAPWHPGDDMEGARSPGMGLSFFGPLRKFASGSKTVQRWRRQRYELFEQLCGLKPEDRIITSARGGARHSSASTRSIRSSRST